MKIIISIKILTLKTIFILLSCITFKNNSLRRRRVALGIILLGIIGLSNSCSNNVRYTCYKPSYDPPKEINDSLKNE